MRRPAVRHVPRRTPLLLDNPIENLIDVLAVAEECPAQNTFLDGADLLQRTVATAIASRGTRFHAVHSEAGESELEHEVGTFFEEARAPELGGDRKAPLGDPEVGLDFANLEDA